MTISVVARHPEPGPLSLARLAQVAFSASVVQPVEVDQLVQDLLASWQHAAPAVQRRRWHRAQFDRPLVFVPLDEHSQEPIDRPRRVSGKDISLHGISFSHSRPLPYTKVAVAFAVEGGGCEPFLTRLTWCRFTRNGIYQSGGQFLKRLDDLAFEADLWWADATAG